MGSNKCSHEDDILTLIPCEVQYKKQKKNHRKTQIVKLQNYFVILETRWFKKCNYQKNGNRLLTKW